MRSMAMISKPDKAFQVVSIVTPQRFYASLPAQDADKIDSELSKVRNIGISAHIDSGKTTLTERDFVLHWKDPCNSRGM